MIRDGVLVAAAVVFVVFFASNSIAFCRALLAARAFRRFRQQQKKKPWEKRPTGFQISLRVALYPLGATVRVRALRFVGRIDCVYADYWAALDAFAVPQGWYEMQNHKPATKDQVFYGVVALDGRGAVLVGEQDVEAA